MSDSNYSEKKLLDKLGYKAGETVFTQGAPSWLALELAAYGITAVEDTPADWAHLFCVSRLELADFLDRTDITKIKDGIWVSWPKKTSGVETDVSEQLFRDVILPLGWVDTKVCAIDETWSALKFLRRKA